MTEDDKKLQALEVAKRELCAMFRKQMSDILNEERKILGLTDQAEHEIEIYY